MSNTKRLLFLCLFLTLPLLLSQHVSASNSLQPSADAYVMRNAPTQNFDDKGLFLSYDGLGGVENSAETYLQFDLSGSDPISAASFYLTVAQDQLNATSASVTLYAVADDSWTEGAITDATKPALGAALQTLTLPTNLTFDSSTLATYLEAQRTGDGIASLALKIDSVTGGSIFGALLLGDREQNGDLTAPALYFNGAAPTAVGLGSVQLSTPSHLLLLLIASILAMLSLVSLRGRWRAPKISSKHGRFVAIALLLAGSLFTFFQSSTSYAATCSGVPTLYIQESDNAIVLSWAMNPLYNAVDVYSSTTDPFFETGTQIASDLTDAQLTLARPAIGKAVYYKIVPQCEIAGEPTPSNTVGAQTYALTPNGTSFVGMPFLPQGLVSAEILAQSIPGTTSLRQWNINTQGFHYFFPPQFGNNFEIKPGDALFITTDSSAPTSFTAVGDVIRTSYPLSSSGYSLFAVPMQSDATTADALAAQIGAVTDVLGWNGSLDSSNFALANGSPVIVQGVADTPAFWPGFQNGLITWSQTYGGAQRDILLQWQTNDGIWPPAPYVVERREIGDDAWQTVGEVSFPNSAELMRDLLGDTFDILRVDLRDAPTDPNLDPQQLYDKLGSNPNLAALLSQQYADVSIATGRGFLDGDVDNNDWEYRVVPVTRGGGALALDAVCTPYSAAPTYSLTGLRDSQAVNLAYADHGVRGGDHPADAANRLDWGAWQQTRLMDGRSALIWDDPVTDFTPPSARGSSCVAMPESAGANFVLRKKPAHIPGGDTFVLVNEVTEGGGLLGVRPSGSPTTDDPHNEAYYFSDYIARDMLGEDPDDIYTDWEYEACAVNMLGETLNCATHETSVREFDAPAAIISQTITLPTDHSELTLTFAYSDTSEISLPLYAHVMRADAAMTPLDQWEDVSDPIEISDPSYATYSFSDAPALGETKWYRVQIRDDAGNWSAPSPPIFSTRHDRSAVPFPTVYNENQTEDADFCATQSLPFTSGALDERVKQIAVYRAFSPGGQYDLITRIWPDEGPPKTFTFEDDYAPPFGTVAYYRFEAIDGHGNISAPTFYCAALEGVEPIPPADVDVSVSGSTLTVGFADVEFQPLIDVTCAGDGGNETFTVAPTGTPWAQDLPTGATCEVNVRNRDAFGTTLGAPTSFTTQVNNDFLNTNRQLTSLGPIVDMNEVAGNVRILLSPNDQSNAAPYGALFRRPVGGTWVQVSNMQTIAPIDGQWQIWDTATRSDGVAYEYVTLAFSHQSYELLGYWDVATLAAQGSASSLQISDTTMAPITSVDYANCVTATASGDDLGLPEEILLHNGWRLVIEEYYLGDVGGSCPVMLNNPDSLYGYALLTGLDGSEWGIDFVDMAISGSQHVGGRISTNMNSASPNTDTLNSTITQIEFLPSEVNAIVEIGLPDMVQLIKTGYRDSLVGKVSNVKPLAAGGWSFDGVAVGAVEIVDESLLWQFATPSLTVFHDRIQPIGVAGELVSRLGELMPNVYCFTVGECASVFDQGNNGLLTAQEYVGSDVAIRRGGLDGTFTHGGAFEYRTSFPGQFAMGLSGVTLNVENSRIVDGSVDSGQASFERINNGTVTDYMLYDASIVTPTERLVYRSGFLPSTVTAQRETVRLNFLGAFNMLGEDGQLFISAEITTPPLTFNRLTLAPTEGTLFIAPMQSIGAGLSGAPAPAVAAWQESGLNDPGFNLTFTELNNAVAYDCFSGGNFGGSADVYVRAGGVSENVIISGESAFRSNSRGYQEQLNSFNALYLDNGLLQDDTTQRSDLFLPYPSDVTLPLEATAFRNGCAADFTLLNGVNQSAHDYWGLDVALTGVSYQPTVGTALAGLDAALGSDKELVVLEGSAEFGGLKFDTSNAAQQDDAITLKLATAWLPTGDIGNFSVLQHGNEVAFSKMYRVNGANFALSDVKINRYYSDPFDTSSLPSTLGLDQTDANLSELPLVTELFNNGYDTQNSTLQQQLADCPLYLVGPCGLIMLDGEAYVEYFGRIEAESTGSRTPFDPLDNPVGDYPLAATNRTTITVQHVVKQPSLHWMWPILNERLDELLPIGVMLNSNGGALAYARPDVEILPVEGFKFLEGDLGAVVQLAWSDQGYDDKIGVFFGATASQAALRALAMNRPNEDGTAGTLPLSFCQSGDPDGLIADLTDYAEKFNYSVDGTALGNSPDVVDLACRIWSDGLYDGNTGEHRDFSYVYQALVDKVKAKSWDDTYGGYGISDLAVGDTLSSISGIDTDKGLGQATFWLPSSPHGLEIDFIAFGSKVSFDSANGAEKDKLFHADWLEIVFNRDKELIMTGEGIQSSLTGDYDITADAMLLIGTKPGSVRVEGGIRLHEFEASEITFKDVGATFGLGQYSGDTIAYLGVMGEGSWDQYRLGGVLLFGSLYDSDVIRFAGFGDALDRLQSESPDGDPGVFLGFYLGVYGDIPVYSDALIEANASGDVRFWYFKSDFDFDNDGVNDAVYGGELNAGVYATVAKVVSGRGNLGLAIESIFPGGTSRVPASAGDFSQIARRCPTDAAANPLNTNCIAFTGTFWIAAGVGACSPNTWTTWTGRWWDDSWCANAGAIVGLGYIDQPDVGEDSWKFDYELDYEAPWD